MAIQPRHIIAALVAAFMIGTIGGGIGLLSGGGGSGTTAIAGADTTRDRSSSEAESDADRAESDRRDAAEREARKARQQATGAFTAEAVKEGSGRIVISGVASSGKPGTPIVVQRKESGAWTDFPADATTGADGSYSVWLITGREGENTFRVKDQRSGSTSNPVTVRV